MPNWLKKLIGAIFGEPDPKPTPPPPDPDPVLPAKALSIQWGTDPQQTVTIYLPARRASELVALLLMFHGGGWWEGDPDSANVVDAKKAWLNPQGIAFATGGYRLGTRSTPKIDPYMEAQDVAALCEYLHKNGASHGLDMTRFALMAHSAGAQLGAEAITALGAKVDAFVGLDSACYDPPSAMALKIPDPDLRQIYEDAFGDDPAFQALCSPLQQMKAAPPPMLLVCSSQRGKANIAQANAFAAQARTFDTPAEVIEIDLPHGEINSKLGTTADEVSGAYTQQVSDWLLPRLR